MSDAYQAVYDAVRSKLHGFNPNEAIRDAVNVDAGWAIEHVKAEFCAAAVAMQEACAIYRPSLSIDGNQWCALYGNNIQDGVAGFGDSPALAMQDFNRNWHAKLSEARGETC